MFYSNHKNCRSYNKYPSRKDRRKDTVKMVQKQQARKQAETNMSNKTAQKIKRTNAITPHLTD